MTPRLRLLFIQVLLLPAIPLAAVQDRSPPGASPEAGGTHLPEWGTDIWAADFYDAAFWGAFEWRSRWSGPSRGDDASGARGTGKGGVAGHAQKRRTASSVVHTFVTHTAPVTVGGELMSSTGQVQPGGEGLEAAPTDLARISGRILGVREMRLRDRDGETDTFIAALLGLPAGRRTVAILGRGSELKAWALREGEPLMAVGSKGAVSGRTVFVAHRLDLDGRTIPAVDPGGAGHPDRAVGTRDEPVTAPRGGPSTR